MDINSKIKLLTGNSMPIMGLGTWELTKNTADTISYALELGYPMIDTSSDYGTQPGIGEGIKKSGKSRDSFYLVTKVEESDDSYQRVVSSLEELDLKYADLILIHRPPETGVGEELWEGLIRAKEEGLTKDIGVSNYSFQQIEQLFKATGEMPVVNQIEWSPFGYSPEMLNYCKDKGIIIQAYSPLTRKEKADTEPVRKIAKKHNKTPEQVLIRWNLQLRSVPLPKANKKEHLEQNIDVFDFKLDRKDMETLNNLNEHYSALGSLPYIKHDQDQQFKYV